MKPRLVELGRRDRGGLQAQWGEAARELGSRDRMALRGRRCASHQPSSGTDGWGSFGPGTPLRSPARSTMPVPDTISRRFRTATRDAPPRSSHPTTGDRLHEARSRRSPRHPAGRRDSWLPPPPMEVADRPTSAPAGTHGFVPGRSIVSRCSRPGAGADRRLRLRGPGAREDDADPPERAGARLERIRGSGTRSRSAGVRDWRPG